MFFFFIRNAAEKHKAPPCHLWHLCYIFAIRDHFGICSCLKIFNFQRRVMVSLLRCRQLHRARKKPSVPSRMSSRVATETCSYYIQQFVIQRSTCFYTVTPTKRTCIYYWEVFVFSAPCTIKITVEISYYTKE